LNADDGKEIEDNSSENSGKFIVLTYNNVCKS